ncbi:helix-turn-helix transcriptional regulator [Leptospira interrogans]|nr:helix-turn-helix transcriptional regulator [Leptospira interrogans]ULG93603.1 helix-turn-helix transcriptional regulator [Leptospira interrogans]
MKDRIRALLKELGITQKEFAETVGISQGFVSEIINGKNVPSHETLTKMVLKYRVNMNWLLSGEGSMFLPSSEELDKQTDEIRFIIRKLREREGMLQFVQRIVKTTDSEWKKVQEMVRLLLGQDE